MDKDFQTDLVVLALAVGFKTATKDKNIYLTTIYKDQTRLYRFEEKQDDMLCGKGKEILAIIDERLGIKDNDTDLKKRYKVFYEALADDSHPFWQIAKANLEKYKN